MLIQRLEGPGPVKEAEIKAFIEELDRLVTGMKDSITTERDYLTNGENVTPVIVDLSNEASGIFIDDVGQSIHTTFLAIYSANKYRIVPGEQDNSGWLSGVIVTPKGRIVYG